MSVGSDVLDPRGEAASEAQKQLVLYELDLGLNHVISKSSEPVDNGANLLIPVPGGEDGPGGVLVCAENYLIYMKDGMPELIQAVIPRRANLRGDRGVLIVAWAKHQVKTMFFFLLQVGKSKAVACYSSPANVSFMLSSSLCRLCKFGIMYSLACICVIAQVACKATAL